MFDMSKLMFRALSASLLAGALTLSTAAFAQDRENPLSAIGKLFGGDRQQQGAGEGDAQPMRESPPDQAVRIERLEAQIRQMTGTIEQLQYRNQQLEQQVRAGGGGQPSQATVQPMPQQQPQQRTIQSVPSQGLPPPSAGPAAGPPPAPAPQGGRRSDVFDPNQHPNAPGAPQTLGSMNSASREQPPAPIVASEPPVGVPDGRGAGAPLDLSTLATGIPPGARSSTNVASAPVDNAAPPTGALPPPPPRNMSATGAVVASTAPPSENAQGYYDLAYGYVLRKDYAFAEDALQTFIRKYPSDVRVPDAQFWLGESLFQRQRYDAAAEAFLAVSTKHDQHAKAPDALLRLGQSLAALNQKEMACATLAEVGRKYPKASNTVKQGVDREQKRVRC
jgi:tol-pal system protein YbgF